MIAIVYARVSGEDQAKTGFSLPSQIEAGKARAAELGATETLVFTDEGIPGDVLERPGLQGALDVLRRTGVTLFICHDPDRLARSLSLQLVVTDQIERTGVRMEFIDFEYRNTPEGQLFYSMRGAISQFEKAKIRERTMRGKRQKAKAGGLTHSPNLYGYDFDTATDTLSINSDQAEIIRMIFGWFINEDIGPWLIAQRLTDMGIPTNRGGAAWNHSSVRNILRNESYTGTLYQQKWDYTNTRNNKYRPKGEKVKRKLKPKSEWLPVQIPPIIDQATYQAAQVKLENARRWWSGWHVEEYLLSGLSTCTLCRRPIYGASRKSGKSRIRYYVCRGYAPGIPGQPRCPFGRIHADEVEHEVWQEVRGWILEPSRLQRIMSQQTNTEHIEKELEAARQQLEEARAEHERTIRLTVKGSINQEVAEGLLKEQQERIARLQAQMKRLEARNTDTTALALQTMELEKLRKKIEPVIDQLTFTQRQQIVRAMVKSVELSKTETVIHARLASAVSEPPSA